MGQLKLAARAVAKTPFVTTVAILSLALGIGANAAIYSLFDQMLFRPLPVHAPERLVNLAAPGPKPGSQSCNQAGDCDVVFSFPMFRDLQREQRTFTGVAAHRIFGANLAHRNRTLKGEGMLVSGSYFPVLGLRPAVGRLLGPGDGSAPGESAVTVLSHRFWTGRMGSDPGVVGETMVVNGRPMTIVGVAPRGFEGATLGARPDVFVPITMRGAVSPGFDAFENRRSYWVYLFGRLEPGVSMEQAHADLNRIYGGIIDDVEAPLQEGMSDQTMARFRAKEIAVEPGARGQSSLHGEARTPLVILLAITGIVLLIACANIANLLLARGAERSREMAIRGSLGARRSQLVARLLAESGLLALAGGLTSLPVARWTLSGIAAILPPEATRILDLELRPSVVGFAAVLAVGTGLLFGIYPALHATRAELASALRADSGQPAGSRAAARFRSVLATAQIALSMALLVAAGLFIKSLANVSRVDLGLRAERVVTFGLSPELNGYEPERSRAVFRTVEEEMAAIPGVTAVSSAMVPLLAGSNWGTDVSVQGFEGGPDIDQNSRYNEVGPGYFRTVGMTVVAGRGFTAADDADGGRVAVVNEAFTRKFGLGGPEAVGNWMSRDPRAGSDLDIEIVGVVGDAKYSEVKQEVPPLFFTPYRQDPRVGSLTFYLRTTVDPASVLRAVPRVMEGVDPNLPVEDLKTLERQVQDNIFLDRMITTLSAAFALLATLLAAVGLYGVLAYTVARRTREIGLRMALGARARHVRRMVLRRVAVMMAVGGALGLAGALALGRAARSLLFELQGHDPRVIATTGALLSLIAVAAAYLPARRATRVDPMEALRYE